MVNLFFAFSWSFLVALFAVPSIIFVATHKNLLDLPNSRSIHKKVTPRLGGVAIFAGFISALTIFGDIDHSVQQIIAGAILIFFIGVKDDLIVVSPLKKIFVQILATCLVMFIGDIRISSFHGVFDVYEIDIVYSYIFTMFIILALTNAINLIDGQDGLAGSIICFCNLIFCFYFYKTDITYSIVAICLAGASVGFLKYNIYKAKIFMGDTGSLLGGFITSILAIKFVETEPVDSAPIIAIAILIIPIFDTLRIFTLRLLKGKSPFVPDKNHIHHCLLSLGLSQIKVLSILLVLNASIFSLILTNIHLGTTNLTLLIFGILILLSWLLEYARKYSNHLNTV